MTICQEDHDQILADPKATTDELREIVKELQGEVAALTKERDELKTRDQRFSLREPTALRSQLAAAQATNERLREALNMVLPYAKKIEYAVDGLPDPIIAAIAILALPNDTTALDARLKEERERCAKELERLSCTGLLAATHAIRSMT